MSCLFPFLLEPGSRKLRLVLCISIFQLNNWQGVQVLKKGYRAWVGRCGLVPDLPPKICVNLDKSFLPSGLY